MNARRILITSCLLALLHFLPAEAAEWEKLPSLPEPNSGFMHFIYQDSLVIAGGTNWEGQHKKLLNSLHFLNTKTLAWDGSDKLDSPIAYGVSLSGGFVGGTDGQKPVKALFNFDGEKSYYIGYEHLPDSIVLAAGGLLKSGVIILVGGTRDASNLAGLTKDTTLISGANKVETLPSYPGKPIGIAASAVVGDQLYIFAGAHWDASRQTVVNTNEAYAFSMESKSWRQLVPFRYAVRGLTAIPLSDRFIYLAGGYKNDTDGFTDEAFLYDLQKNTYLPAKSLPYRAMVSLARFDGFVYCLGGEDKQKSRTDACFRIPVAELMK